MTAVICGLLGGMRGLHVVRDGDGRRGSDNDQHECNSTNDDADDRTFAHSLLLGSRGRLYGPGRLRSIVLAKGRCRLRSGIYGVGNSCLCRSSRLHGSTDRL